MANAKGNPQNLKSLANRTEEEKREIARKGGLARAKKQKEDKLMRDGFAFLDHLKAFSLFRIVETDEGYYLRDTLGYVMEYEQVKDICEGLMNYAERHKGELVRLNDCNEERCIRIRDNFNDKMDQFSNSSLSHVYLMECENKYKIGVSKNVTNRLKQLDTRPFKLSLVTKSRLLDNAYDIEKQLHKHFCKQRLDGEWFDLDEGQVESLKNYLKNL